MTETEIRPAATVLLVRDSVGGVQVFMLRRNAAAVFAGGMYVFPGGRVDDADGPEESDLAYRTAAIRECFEEAGVLLATAAGEPLDDDHPALARRHEVHDGELSMTQLCADYDLQLSTGHIHWLQRWVTPKGELARRFDTRFYIAAQPAGQDSAVHDNQETVASMWVVATEALAAHERGDLFLLPPTVAALQFLADHDDVAAVLDAASRIGEPPKILPKLKPGVQWQILLPGEPGYDELD